MSKPSPYVSPRQALDHATGLERAEPRWDFNEVGGFVKSASAVIVLDEPRLNPDGPSTTVFLEVTEDEELLEFQWVFGTGEDQSNFGSPEYGRGQSVDLAEAQHECWAETIDFLRMEGYSDEEIAAAL